MTAAGPARPYAKSSLGGILLVALALGFGVFGGSTLGAATTERIVADRHTGLALYGIDPVAYFTARKPVAGREDFEYRHAGVIWRFENEGNRAAFAADPEVYTPRFGGYDPIGIARGVSTPGFPQLWSLVEDRLYFFYTPQAREAFMADPAAAIAAAAARWPDVLRDLAD
jgi:hypothetical protein